MFLFFLSYFLLYGGVHVYFVWKAHRAFPGALGIIIPASLSLFMLLAPMGVRAFSGRLPFFLAQSFTFLTYAWFAWIFWFLCMGILLDLWNLFAWGLARTPWVTGSLALSPRVLFGIVIAAIALASMWGVIEARSVRLREKVIETDKLPSGVEIRIAQISDVHLSLILRKGQLSRILKRVNEARPDLLISTGDLIDLGLDQLEKEAALLAEIRPPLGKIAIMGNHEFYVGIDKSIEFHEAAGFPPLLRASGVAIGDYLYVAGVDDPGHGGSHASAADEDAALPPAGSERYVIFLKHRPVVLKKSLPRFDLQLSGHVHGGQIFPFGCLVGLFFDYGVGWHSLGERAEMYVTTGSGTWGPPFRVLAPPEVVLVRIVGAGIREQ
ncbi:metallophosphoesterase [bacterium]|nr:metallophosphoesterase [bacterium]